MCIVIRVAARGFEIKWGIVWVRRFDLTQCALYR